MQSPLTCKHYVLTAGYNIDTFEQYIICVTCNTKMLLEWLKKRNWEYDIDVNVWTFLSMKKED